MKHRLVLVFIVFFATFPAIAKVHEKYQAYSNKWVLINRMVCGDLEIITRAKYVPAHIASYQLLVEGELLFDSYVLGDGRAITILLRHGNEMLSYEHTDKIGSFDMLVRLMFMVASTRVDFSERVYGACYHKK